MDGFAIVVISIRHSTFVIRSPLASKIRNFILLKTRFCRVFDQFVIHVAGEVLIHIELACLQLREERSVLFIDHFVTREVLAAQGGCFGECGAPGFRKVTGDQLASIARQYGSGYLVLRSDQPTDTTIAATLGGQGWTQVTGDRPGAPYRVFKAPWETQ